MYPIQSVMLSSDIAGTPYGKRAACSSCVVPADISVTLPLIATLVPNSVANLAECPCVIWQSPYFCSVCGIDCACHCTLVDWCVDSVFSGEGVNYSVADCGYEGWVTSVS